MTTKTQPSYYAIIPADVRYAKIPDGAKLLYGEITALCNKEGYCWASNRHFSELYDVRLATISEWIKALKNQGFIEVNLDQNTSREIRLTLTENRKGGSEKPQAPLTENRKHSNKDNIKMIKPLEDTPAKIARDFFENQEPMIKILIEKGLPENIVRHEIAKFVAYWTEPTKSGRMQRWETKEAFEITRRLATWFSHAREYAHETKGIRI